MKCFASFLLVLAGTLYAQETLTVVGLRGNVEAQKDGVWRDIDLGDVLMAEHSVRLSSEDASLVLEIRSPGVVPSQLLLRRSGTVALAAAVREWKSAAPAQTWLDNFSRTLSGRRNQHVAALGGRGDRADAVENPAHRVTGDLGWKALEAGNRSEAAARFEEALYLAPEGAAAEYELGLCQALDTEETETEWLAQALGLAVPSDGRWKGEVLLMKARALVQTGRLDEMESLIATHSVNEIDTETHQSLLLMLAFSRLAAGDRTGMRAYVRMIVELEPGNEAAHAARMLLASR